MNEQLVQHFRTIKEQHRCSVREKAARTAPGPSVMRTFEAGTRAAVIAELDGIPVDELHKVTSADAFRACFERWLESLAEVIRKHNRHNPSIYPGYKWGHSAKILNLFLRDVVDNRYYFSENVVSRLCFFLYVPIDSVVMDELRRLGYVLPFSAIREIDTAAIFYDVQDMLRDAAAVVGIPRVWFDDVWGLRREPRPAQFP